MALKCHWIWTLERLFPTSGADLLTAVYWDGRCCGSRVRPARSSTDSDISRLCSCFTYTAWPLPSGMWRHRDCQSANTYSDKSISGQVDIVNMWAWPRNMEKWIHVGRVLKNYGVFDTVDWTWMFYFIYLFIFIANMFIFVQSLWCKMTQILVILPTPR